MNTGVFCDYLKVTCSKDDAGLLHDEVSDLMFEVGAKSEAEGLWRLGPYGAVRTGVAYRVGYVDASGGALSYLREQGAYGAYLRTLSSYPHRVTRVDATLDVACDSPKVIRGLYLRASRGSVALSRKAIKPSGVKAYLGPGHIDGRETGTIYLGLPTAEVRGVVYDKREQLISRGDSDPGPLLRYEVRVTNKLGPTLRDAWQPSSMFYHFASPDLLPCPNGVLPWEPGTTGFELPPVVKLTPQERLRKVIMDSPHIGELCEQAFKCGPGGIDELIHHIRQRYVIREKTIQSRKAG